MILRYGSILALLVLLTSVPAVAQTTITVTGAGTARANTTLTYVFDDEGKPAYADDTFEIIISWNAATGRWRLIDATASGEGVLYYYEGDTALPPPDGWTAALGATPVPTLSGDGVLPVELVSFDAVTDGDGALLRWMTAGETNNAGFDVERRTGETAWHQIGFVAGKGTTAETQTYTYHAGSLAPGRHVFRLRQVDYDGAFEYSPEIEVTVGVPGTHLLSEIYPNPFNPQTSFTLAVDVRQHVRVAVYDVLGRQVALLHNGQIEAGQAQHFAFDGAGLPSGTYRLHVDGETFQESRGLVLAK